MVGPVLHHEMMLGSRRSRAAVFRWIYGGWLVLLVIAFYFEFGMSNLLLPNRGYATPVVSSWFVQWFLVQQLILLVLATPVLTAGALTDEKTRGTLQYLLTTDLQSWHIIVGKLLGRIAQVGLLALTGLPLLCFLGVYAGVKPITLVAVAAVTIMPLLAVGSASLLASVWSRQTHAAVLALYLVSLPFLGLVWLVQQAGTFHPVCVVGVVIVEVFLVLLWLLREQPWRDLAGALFFLVLALLVLLFWVAGLLPSLDPLYVVEPVGGGQEDVAEMAARLVWSIFTWGSLAVLCLSMAVWQLRPAYIRQLEGEGRKKPVRWWRARRAPIAEQPLLWKERHVEGVAPVSALRVVPRWLALLVVFLVSLVSSSLVLLSAAKGSPSQIGTLLLQQNWAGLLDAVSPVTPGTAAFGFELQGLLVMLVAGLIVGIRCSGAVSGEREKKTWEALLLTPLSTRQLIRGKLWGIIGASYVYMIVYALPALALSALTGLASFFWTALWYGVTWTAMYFMGAAGLWCSVRAKSSWRSLLGTVGIGYVGGLLVYLLTTPLLFILALFIVFFLALVDQFLQTTFAGTALGAFAHYWDAFVVASCLGLAGIFWGMGYFFLNDAQKWVADRERTRHWKDEPRRVQSWKRPERVRFYR